MENIDDIDKNYNITYQNIYDYKNVSKYIIILFAFLFIIYLITIFNQYN